MNNKEFLESVFEDVLELDIVEVVEGYMDIAKKVGDNYLGLCPFHNDNKLGSFVINPSKRMFNCFACGTGGDVAKFVEMFTGVTYVTAAFDIALNNNLITQDEYNNFFDGVKIKKTNRTSNRVSKKKKERKEEKRHEDLILDVVYNVFLDNADLRENHKKHLEEIRGLSEEIIKERKYKSNVLRNNNFMKRFRDGLSKREELKGMSLDDVLRGTPGFFKKEIKYGYKNRNTKWIWNSIDRRGIFIPARNEKGQIVGLQLRVDELSDNKQRYIWFSSSFTSGYDESEGFKYGSSPGTPLDVLYPSITPSRGLFITEGRFKSEILAEKLGVTVISVQGVGNYKGIDELIKEVEKETKERFKDFTGYENICIAFDNELDTNPAVYNHLRSMSDIIKESNKEKDIFYITWKLDKYKGIDDLLLSNEAKKVKNYHQLLTINKKEDYDKANESKTSQVTPINIKKEKKNEIDKEYDKNIKELRKLKRETLKKVNKEEVESLTKAFHDYHQIKEKEEKKGKGLVASCFKDATVLDTTTEIFRTQTNFRNALRSTELFVSVINCPENNIRDYTENEIRNITIILDMFSEWRAKEEERQEFCTFYESVIKQGGTKLTYAVRRHGLTHIKNEEEWKKRENELLNSYRYEAYKRSLEFNIKTSKIASVIKNRTNKERESGRLAS